MTSPTALPDRVAILGFARSGQALARALLDRAVEVSVGESKPEVAFAPTDLAFWKGRGVRFFFDGPAEGFLQEAGWLAVSPGVPMDSPAVQAARALNLPVLAELEIAWRLLEAEGEGGNRWIAVTGTNGKSTTTAWIADILRRQGRPVALAGNIGVPLSQFLGERAPRDFVCELSSFQLESTDTFRPHAAVLTNITPDHLDRYPSFARYVEAKERVFRNQGPEDFAVLNADDPAARAVRTAGRRVLFSRTSLPVGGAGIEDGWLVSDVVGKRRKVLPRERLALRGAHNLENALAVLAAADCLETPADAVTRGLMEFAGLPHRTELVAVGKGVRWVNDSKGTNVDATKKSLEGSPAGSVILILGGRDKHGDFPRLTAEVHRAARAVLTIGEAAGAIEKALSGVASIERAGTMEEAVRRAAILALPGDTVLLSPACASFDQYTNFEERGRHFSALARAAAGRAPEDSPGYGT